MSKQRLDVETQQRMSIAFYGALEVINRHKKPGEALHAVPVQYVTRPAHVPPAANEGVTGGLEHGV